MKIQESAENYLETILMLSEKHPYVRSIDIATELGFSKPSVSVAMKNLRVNNLILVNDEGHITLTDEGRRAFLNAWQSKKQEQITHPFLKEKLPWGLVPYVQALLLARTLRGDLELYPPFFWK